MPDYRSMFDRDYIYAFDLAGKDVTVTIVRVVGGTLTAPGGRKTRKPVIYFDGKDRGLALNKTNSKTIAGMYGNDTDNWIGKRVTLFPTTTTFGDEQRDCIRIRPRIPAGRPRRVNGDAPAAETEEQAPVTGPDVAQTKAKPWDEQEPPMGALESDREAG